MKEELGGGLEKGMPHRGQSGAKVLSTLENRKRQAWVEQVSWRRLGDEVARGAGLAGGGGR